MRISIDDFLRQGSEIAALKAQLDRGQMVHATLIAGEEGLGKKTLAGLAAQALLCKSEGRRPCGFCRDCVLAEKEEHPDLTVIRRKFAEGGEKTGKLRSVIPIDDIRDMIRQCGVSTLDGGNRVVIITEADRMTAQAQNCLLKTLEEPPDRTFFLLVSDHPEALLSTVISRCRMVRLHPWDDVTVLRVLKDIGTAPERARAAADSAGGSIGRAVKLAGDEEYWQRREEVIKIFFRSRERSEIAAISNEWKDRRGEGEEMLNILENLDRDMLLVRLGRKKPETLSELPANWRRFAMDAPQERFAALSDGISLARKQLAASVNFQAVLEQLLFNYMGEGLKWRE